MNGIKFGTCLSNKICDEIKYTTKVKVEYDGESKKKNWGDIVNSLKDWKIKERNS